MGGLLRALPAEEVLARLDPTLRVAGLPPGPFRHRCLPREDVGQPAANRLDARRTAQGAPSPIGAASRRTAGGGIEVFATEHRLVVVAGVTPGSAWERSRLPT